MSTSEDRLRISIAALEKTLTKGDLSERVIREVHAELFLLKEELAVAVQREKDKRRGVSQYGGYFN